MENLFPKVPLDKWVEKFVDYLGAHLGGLFDIISAVIAGWVDLFSFLFNGVPAGVFIPILTLLAWKFSKRSIALFTLAGLLLISNLGYWENTMETLALVLTAALISIIVGIPTGILCARKDTARDLVMPLLDFMQTMPAFVYLIPAIFFFGLGKVPGVIASVIFAMPPTIRLTNLGIRQVPAELIEAADAFGSTPTQKLLKVQLPLAKQTIMAGINQCIMLALSMVVIASMIGAKGLGADVYRAVTQIKIGVGFEAGLAIVVLAIILDRMTQNIGRKHV
ncbi:binding-protein-dependent transport systems inner membrane component [Desulforamulus reducens MI-1]|uniref:Binding-protein-dependent transport systems inner membrane component n=1 Tax=Desulforamulus reducens (strain ATCC BAA-1160 / DSM 100696 / MI-1) TaxID=349161 RepID=A4J9F7_DESRM|nr:proline/glycine betaine ABC transporter permease [Desulforamulus reducens]ABO51710.1 binding-protein-dependent transport systems inner membrane component [Desulforamulus reducens MI-1]